MNQISMFGNGKPAEPCIQKKRIEWKVAKAIADDVVEQLRPCALRIEIAGSVRRKTPTCGDIEIVAIKDESKIMELYNITERWTFIKGKVTGKYCQRVLPQGVTLDLFFATPENWAVIYAIRTGSAEFSRDVLARTWSQRGYVSEGGILHRVTNCEGAQTACRFGGFTSFLIRPLHSLRLGAPIVLREEIDLFNFLEIPWREPEDRNGK